MKWLFWHLFRFRLSTNCTESPAKQFCACPQLELNKLKLLKFINSNMKFCKNSILKSIFVWVWHNNGEILSIFSRCCAWIYQIEMKFPSFGRHIVKMFVIFYLQSLHITLAACMNKQNFQSSRTHFDYMLLSPLSRSPQTQQRFGFDTIGSAFI